MEGVLGMSVYIAKDELIRVIVEGQEEHYTKHAC